MSGAGQPALLRHLGHVPPWSPLGTWPTPVEAIAGRLPELRARSLFVKRDDLSSAVHGGSKVRALEPLLGDAVQRGALRVCASGAWGSNSLAATALHASRLGLLPRAVAYAQPQSAEALSNVEQVLSVSERFVMLPHWSLVPLALARESRAGLRGEPPALVLPPALLSPVGALGYVSGALELAEQVGRGELEQPSSVVIGLGSACTAAGLLVGFWLAQKLGFSGWSMPRVVAVRVAPWPLASASMALGLALQTARLVAKLRQRPLEVPTKRELSAHLVVDGSQLGAGYGIFTPEGRRTKERFREAGLCPLDEVYSAKISAGFFDWVRRAPDETTLLWATHSSAERARPSAPRCEVPWLLARILRNAGKPR